MDNIITSKKALTWEYNGIVKAIHTPCGISKPFRNGIPLKDKGYIPFMALWDTGATSSAISINVVKILNLESIGRVKMYHANGEAIVKKYRIGVFLPNDFEISNLEVMELKLNNMDMIIGMDIISLGDFVINSPEGKTKFSFQIPSTHDTNYCNENEQVRIKIISNE